MTDELTPAQTTAILDFVKMLEDPSIEKPAGRVVAFDMDADGNITNPTVEEEAPDAE